MIKTVTLTGPEVKVTDLGGQNAAVKNLGSGSIYVSTKPNITAGADNVIEIPAGAGEVVLDAHGTVYIVGTGKVQCTGTSYAVPNFKLPSSSSGGGGGTSDVTKEYVDAQDATNLNLAKAYTDNAKSEIQTTIDTVDDTLNTHIADQVKHITAAERTAWNAKAETDTATSTANGLMSAADKKKLDGIDEKANKYTLPVATSSILGGVKLGYSTNGKNYKVTSSNAGLYVTVPWTDTNTTYTNFVKSGSGAKSGLVPAPSTTAGTTKYLREDGTWTVPPDTTYSEATTSAAGLMSAADKSSLNTHIADQVKHITAEERAAWNAKAELTDIPTELPANGGNADTVDGLHANEIASNPNLLINPDFKINQRGSTTYTGKRYTVDRWFNSTDYTVSTITDNGIKIGMINPSGVTSEDFILGQIGTQLEPETVILLRGKTITFSINVTKLTAVGAKLMIYERNEIGEPTYTSVKIKSTGINTCQTTIKNDTTKIDVRVYGVDTRTNGEVYTNYTTVQWAKLEVGSIPTIFTPPNPAAELLKCQRYYQKIIGKYSHFGSGFISATNAGIIIIDLPTSLYIKPTTVLNGNIYLNTKSYIAGNGISCNNDSIRDIILNNNDSIIAIVFNIGSDKSDILGQACTAQFRDETSYIEFDAEMDI